jgi:AcrR family transcriptional regulator
MRASVQEVAVAGRRERKKSERDARMYAAARNLFLRQGFEVAAVEQIAEAADIAAATFFTHFQSKHALLGEMTSEVFDRLQALIRPNRGGFLVWPQLAHTLTSKLHALFEARSLSGNATHQESDRWQAKRR